MRRALLTGASSGIGRALAPLLSDAGFHVTLVGRDPLSLHTVLAPSRPFDVLIADLKTLEKVRDLLKNLPPFDLVVLCAGYGVSGRSQDIPLEAYQDSWNVNFFSPVSLIQQTLPAMVASNQGTIVAVTSGVGFRALPYIAPYATAKAALNSFIEGLRVELRQTNLNVLLFSPGPVNSGFQKAKQHHGDCSLDFPPLNGKEPEWVARKLFDAIQKGTERVQLGRNARLIQHLNYWSPKLVDWILAQKFKIKGQKDQKLKPCADPST